MKEFSLLLFFISPIVCVSWMGATLAGNLGFLPTQSISVDLTYNSSALSYYNLYSVTTNFLSNDQLIFKDVMPGSLTTFFFSTLGNITIISQEGVLLNSQKVELKPNQFATLIDVGNNSTTFNSTLSLLESSYRCVFQSTTVFTSQFYQATSPNYFDCVIPDLKGITANSNVTLIRVDVQVGKMDPFSIQGPTKLPQFQVENYWTGAYLPTGDSFAVGASIAVTGTFANNFQYFCTFSILPEQKKAYSASVTTNQPNILTCIVPDDMLDTGAKEDSTVLLVGITKRTTLGSQEITYIASLPNTFPTFIFEEKPEYPDNTSFPATLVAAIVLGIIFVVVVIVVAVVLVRRRMNRWEYSELS